MKKEEIIILSLFIITFVLFLIFSGVWGWMVNEELKAPAVIRDNPPSIQNTNPPNKSLSANQKAGNQPSSGYSVSNLGLPCMTEEQKEGSPNLPASYFVSDCGTGQECRNDVFNGAVCKSSIGFPCLTKQDCVSEANDCLNNVCVSDENKLNSVCVDDSDCQTEANPNNLSCISEGGIKRCKINNYPLGFGCQSFTDCSGLNNNNIVQCVNDVDIEKIGNYDLTATYTSSSNTFTFNTSDGGEALLFPLINSFITANNSYVGGGKIVLIIDGNSSYYYQVGNFNPIGFTFTPIQYPSVEFTTPLSFADGQSYTIRMISSLKSGENFCVSKIPTGGKIEAIENQNLRNLMEDISESICAQKD